jgi:O-methyltransferase
MDFAGAPPDSMKALTQTFKDETMRLAIVRRIAKWLLPGYRLQWPQIAWWRDTEFNEYLRRFHELDGMNSDRRWTLYQLTRLVSTVPGDTAECGVFQGASSFIICRSLCGNTDCMRTHYAFDSFEGLSAPSIADGNYWTKGNLACGLETVKANLQPLRTISWHQGWIPDRFQDVGKNVFSFVHIDVDLYEPTRDSIRFFYPRMNPGGIIICDDYGFTLCPGATLAVDEFLADKPEKMISLPCGGGFFIKGCQTAIRAAL